MNLFAFPIEIRLKIYSEVLVHRGPISFSLPWGDLSSRFYPEEIDLCPTLLCASKHVYGEAISLLYSYNSFRLSDLDETSKQWHTAIAMFVRQIGAGASLLRHVCIDFPTLRPTEDCEHGIRLRGENLDVLDLLQETCPSITTLELLLHSERADFLLRDLSVFTKLLDLLHTHLDSFRALQEVRVEVKLCGWDEQSDNGAEDSEDERQDDSGDERWKTYRDSLRELCSRGWAVNIIKVPLVKEVWTSPDGGIEFDNKDDYHDYMSAWGQREQELEDRVWEDYYHQRQIESYDRGYADDGGPA